MKQDSLLPQIYEIFPPGNKDPKTSIALLFECQHLGQLSKRAGIFPFNFEILKETTKQCLGFVTHPYHQDSLPPIINIY